MFVQNYWCKILVKLFSYLFAFKIELYIFKHKELFSFISFSVNAVNADIIIFSVH